MCLICRLLVGWGKVISGAFVDREFGSRYRAYIFLNGDIFLEIEICWCLLLFSPLYLIAVLSCLTLDYLGMNHVM